MGSKEGGLFLGSEELGVSPGAASLSLGQVTEGNAEAQFPHLRSGEKTLLPAPSQGCWGLPVRPHCEKCLEEHGRRKKLYKELTRTMAKGRNLSPQTPE